MDDTWINKSISHTEFSNIFYFLTLSTQSHLKNFENYKFPILAEGIEIEIKKYLCMDESTIPFRARHTLRQYNPLNPNK